MFGEVETEFVKRLISPLAIMDMLSGPTTLKGAHANILISFKIRRKEIDFGLKKTF